MAWYSFEDFFMKVLYQRRYYIKVEKRADIKLFSKYYACKKFFYKKGKKN